MQDRDATAVPGSDGREPVRAVANDVLVRLNVDRDGRYDPNWYDESDDPC